MANGYALGQLGQAFLTAATHEDADVRRRADERAARWVQTLDAIARGKVDLGSRTPVPGLPAWVTLEVLRGGFATGNAIAAEAIGGDEVAIAQRHGLIPDRRLVFGHYLTDAGLAELYELLDSGRYRVDIPEDAALLTVAWLVRAGDRASALELLETLAPHVDRLRFAPKSADALQTPAEHVFRLSAGEAQSALAGRKPRPRVEDQREALAVWNPFADRVLGLWFQKYDGERVDVSPDPAWESAAAALTAEYERLATLHTRTTKHRSSKSNLAILLAGLRSRAEGHPLHPRELGLVRRAIATSVAKRGAPGTVQHARLREAQQEVARLPGHWQLARLAAARLDAANQHEGLADPSAYAGPVTGSESATAGLPEALPMPTAVPRVLARAHAAPVEELLEQGVVPSAEVLASLVPGISATVVASAFEDPALARLSAANYRAFRRRRSLLLLDLEKQVQITELPWVRATLAHRSATTDEATAVARRVAALALDHFPGTILPNPLVQELDHLAQAGGHELPLVEELAADIFMGRFSDKFRRSAQVAARVLEGTLYERYYGIDYAQVAAMPDPGSKDGRGDQRGKRRGTWRRKQAQQPALTFDELCSARAVQEPTDRRSVAANGTVIEQAQILTTHNLAAVVTLGAAPRRSWPELATACLAQVAQLLELAAHQRRPLATIKDAAYAWRQAVFYLSLATPAESRAFLHDAAREHGDSPALSALVDGLVDAAEGDPPTGAPFLGWTTEQHWILDLLPEKQRSTDATGR